MSQSIEISLLAKATAWLLIGLASVALARRTRASVRHLILAATFAALVATPLVIVAVPERTVAIPVAAVPAVVPPSATDAIGAATVRAQSSVTPVQERSRLSWRAAARVGWVVGAILFLMPVATTLWKLRSLRRRSLPWPEFAPSFATLARECGVQRRVEVMRHEDVASPITFGARRPVIVMPTHASTWSQADLRRALVHELEHVRRGDWIVHLTARTASAAYWLHPLAWIAWRQLVLEAEQSCDDAVVARDERTDYAEQLVTLAQRLSGSAEPALGMAHRSDLAARVSALLDEARPRGRAGIGVAALTIAAAAVMVLALGPLRAVAVARETAAAQRIGNAPRTSEQPRTPRRLRALDRELVEAAQSGDLEDVKDLIDAGASIDASVDGDGSPLIVAARANHLAIVVELLNRGADVNLAVSGDGNPLIAAAAAGAEKVVDLLLSRGAAIDLVVPGDENALIQAAGAGHFTIVKLLVDRGADVNARVWVDRTWSSDDGRGEWRSPLSEARKEHHGAIVAFLLQAGARE
jgi:beta-lactamase regulating signal transducer with metallopeptidase domain